MQIAVDLLIFSGLCSKSLRINSAFFCWFVDFSILCFCWTQKFSLTGCRSLLICWFYLGYVLSLWGLIARFAVDLLIFEYGGFLNPKIQTNRLQITVDLLILSGISSKSLSINSAFSCWFVDFVNDRVCQTQKFRGTGCRSLLICWCVEVLNCWLLNCWPVELLICWAVELLSCWAVDLLIV